MARTVATKWIVGIVVYFIILFAFTYSVGVFSSEYNLEDGGIIGSSGGGLVDTGINETCMNPRQYINPLTGEQYLLNANDGKCNHLIFINSSDCDSLEGCTWVPSAEAPLILRLLGFPDYNATCDGTIDKDYYGWNGTMYSRYDICELPDLNESTCANLGCTWNTNDAFDDIGYTNGFFVVAKIIGDIVTFRVNFSTGSAMINAILTFFLIWVPMIILILSGYVMIR